MSTTHAFDAQAEIAALRAQLARLEAQVAALQQRTAPMQLIGPGSRVPPTAADSYRSPAWDHIVGLLHGEKAVPSWVPAWPQNTPEVHLTDELADK